MRDHGFPKPVRFGGKTSARHWLLTDIEQWERERAKLATVEIDPKQSRVGRALKSDVNSARG
jgi:hypothetical protein